MRSIRHKDRSRSIKFTREEQIHLFALLRAGRRSLLDTAMIQDGSAESTFALDLMRAIDLGTVN